jgi:N-acetylmuramoyl-L-alanine amidase
MPSILIETGFVNNYDDAVILLQKTDKKKLQNLFMMR